MKTCPGRALAYLYHVTSPKEVAALENQSWLAGLTKRPLDHLVARLRRVGIDDSPYRDN